MELAVPRIDETAFVAPGSRVLGNVVVGPRAVIMFGVVIRAELDLIEIGSETNLQDNVVVHCDRGIPCLIGNRVTVGHGAVVHGARIEDRSVVGIGARALNDSRLGEGSWLAAGAVLPEGRSIPPWTVAVGIPAKPLREVNDDERRRQAEGVDLYLDFADLYRGSDQI